MDASEANESPEVAELSRLRRQLRAMGLVNRQLHTQLEGGTMRIVGGSTNGARGALSVRRTAE